MRNKSIAIILTSALAACGGSKPATTTTTTAPAAGILELGEITIFDGTNPMLKIHADGSTEMGSHKGSMKLEPGKTASSDSLPVVWEAGPMLHADGTIDAKGKQVAKVSADGTIVATENGQTLPVAITGNRIKVTAPNGSSVTAELGNDGNLAFIDAPPNTKEFKVHVDGASTPGKVKTALVVLGIVFAPGEMKTETSSAPVSVPADPAVAPTK